MARQTSDLIEFHLIKSQYDGRQSPRMVLRTERSKVGCATIIFMDALQNHLKLIKAIF